MPGIFAMAWAAVLPRVDLAASARGGERFSLALEAGAPDVVDVDVPVRVELQALLVWDLAGLIDDEADRAVSSLRREKADRAMAEAIRRQDLLRRAAAARTALRRATTTQAAAMAEIDRDEALACLPVRP